MLTALMLATSAFSAPLYFDGPEVVKLDWATGSPRAADFNGDGFTDIAIINSDRARIEILLQRQDGVVQIRTEHERQRLVRHVCVERPRLRSQHYT